MYDSKPALHFQSMFSPHTLRFFSRFCRFQPQRHRNLSVKFPWVPSHVGLCHNVTFDRLAKKECRTTRGDGHPLFLTCYLSKKVHSEVLLTVRQCGDAERPLSVTITHYESVSHHKYSFRRQGLLVRRHKVSARLPQPLCHSHCGMLQG